MALGKLWVDANYFYGVADHANMMSSDPALGSAAIATDAAILMQSLAAVGGSTMGATGLATSVATPIINVGLMTLTAASNTLGFGRPEDGERFTDGARQFSEANDELQQAVPPPDWQGDASDAYGLRNTEQQQRAGSMATFDGQIQEVLAEEAGQVQDTRDFVSTRQVMLAAAIPAAITAKLIPPGGAAAAMAIELAAVAATVPFAMQRVTEMVSHSADNADRIRQIGSHYGVVDESAQMPGGLSGAQSGTPAPLRVSESIRGTAGIQQNVAATIDSARSAPDGSAGDVFKTHGVVCTSTAAALKSAELARRSAAEKMHLISTDLSAKLGSSATEYSHTEQQNADAVDRQMPPR